MFSETEHSCIEFSWMVRYSAFSCDYVGRPILSYTLMEFAIPTKSFPPLFTIDPTFYFYSVIVGGLL